MTEKQKVDEEYARIKRLIQNENYDQIQRFINLTKRLNTKTKALGYKMDFQTSISHRHIGESYWEYYIPEYNFIINFDIKSVLNTSGDKETLAYSFFNTNKKYNRHEKQTLLEEFEIEEHIVATAIRNCIETKEVEKLFSEFNNDLVELEAKRMEKYWKSGG